MSEVKDVRDSTGDVTDHVAPDLGAAVSEDLSGYLCGACEEPLPYGASTCVACGTPVAPLEDDEMVAGPYVIGPPAGGEDAPADTTAPDPEPGPDPYASPAPPAPVAPAEWAPPDATAAAAGAVLDLSKHDEDDGLPPPPPTFTGLYDAPADAGPAGNGRDHGAPPPAPATLPADGPGEAPVAADAAPVGVPTYPSRDDPADVIGVERPTYPRPTVGDQGPDPMLGWGPTSPVMTPPGEEAPLLQGLQEADRRAGGQHGDKRGSGLMVVVGGVVALLVAGAVSAVLISRGGQTPSSAAPDTTAAPVPAPPPAVRNNNSAVAPSSTTLPEEPPSLASFCTAALQFRLDPDPDSIAVKFLSNPGQVVATVDALVYNAPEEAKAGLTPLSDVMHTLSTKVSSGELRTAADIRNATGPNGAPLWPRFDQAINGPYAKYCNR